MSMHEIRVEGSTVCHTAQGVEEQKFTYDLSHSPSSSSATSVSSSPSQSTIRAETAALHSLVHLLTLAQSDSNQFLTRLITKYPKPQVKGKKRGKVDSDEEEDLDDDMAVVADVPATSVATVSTPASPASTVDSAETEPKKPKLSGD